MDWTSDIERPSWDDWYMFMAFWVSRRSPDPDTKHGGIFVTSDHRPLGFGYNGCAMGCDDQKLLSERPLKYYAVIHAEENGILHSDRSELKGATVYVTGMPCSRCWAKLIQENIIRVVYGPVSSKCIDEMDVKARTIQLISHPEIAIEEWHGDVSTIESNVRVIMEILNGSGRNSEKTI